MKRVLLHTSTAALCACFLWLCAPPARAQYVALTSSVVHDTGSNEVVGTSRTEMDYYTAIYYQAAVLGKIIRQSDGAELAAVNGYSSPGYNNTAAVQTRAGASVGTDYRLDSLHHVLPLSNNYCTFTRYDYYGYSNHAVYNPTNYGSAFTVHYAGYQPACVQGWIYMGKTTQSVRAAGLNISITSPRVSGNLHATRQSALLGGDVTIRINPNQGGGTTSWSIGGPHQRVSTSPDGTSVVVRWTSHGLYNVTATYSLNGMSTHAGFDVNVVVPTLSGFSGEQVADRIASSEECAALPHHFPAYVLGCPEAPSDINPRHVPGIKYVATATVAPILYLSDPAQSGIKVVQLMSSLRKAVYYGQVRCETARAAEPDAQSGWQLDTQDPYSASTVRRFSESNALTTRGSDWPGEELARLPDAYSVFDAFYVDEHAEVYVVYFTGSDPSNPVFQRPLGFDTNSVAHLPWRWGGRVLFSQSIFATQGYELQSDTPTGAVSAQSRPSMRPYSGNAGLLRYSRCPPDGPYPTDNMIDGSKYFVRQQYLDFFGREPDQMGWDFWRSNITGCVFDTDCFDRKRVDVTRAFFFSGEFIQQHPELGGPRGTHAYNVAFVKQCYYVYLRRTCDPEFCDPPGFNYWVGELDKTNPDAGDWKYNNMIRAFIVSGEYRSRFPAHPAV